MGGYRLKDSISTFKETETITTMTQDTHAVSSSSQKKEDPIMSEQKIMLELPQEPPIEQTQGICTIQIRTLDGTSTPKRRFDIHTHTLQHVFDYASNYNNAPSQDPFQLVTWFPRQVLQPSH